MDKRLSPWSTFWAAVNISPTFKILSQLKNLLVQIMSSTHCAIWPCEVSSVSAPWSSLDNACRETFGFENIFDHSKIVGSVHSTMYIEWNQTKVLLRSIQIWLFCKDLCDGFILERRFWSWFHCSSDLFWAANPGWHIDNFETRIAQRSFGERKKLKTIIWNGNPTPSTSKHWIWTLYYMIVCHKLENTSFHLSGQIWCGAAGNALK